MDLSTTTMTVTPCDDGSYCCGNGTQAQACCRENKGLFVVNGKAVHLNADEKSKTASVTSIRSKPSTSAILSSSSPSSRASQTPSRPVGAPIDSTQVSSQEGLTSSTLSASTNTKSSNNIGAILGGTIGGVAVVVLVIGIILILKRRRNFGDQVHHGPHFATPTDEKMYGFSEAPANPARTELDSIVPVQELGDSRVRHEM